MESGHRAGRTSQPSPRHPRWMGCRPSAGLATSACSGITQLEMQRLGEAFARPRVGEEALLLTLTACRWVQQSRSPPAGEEKSPHSRNTHVSVGEEK